MMKSEKINVYVATLAVWNVKLHNIHWNVEGHLFKGIHEYTESLYDRAAEQYDETAEILKMRGEMPVATVAESLQASVIEELPSRVFSCCEAVAVVQADMEKVAKLAREIRDEAAEADDFLAISPDSPRICGSFARCAPMRMQGRPVMPRRKKRRPAPSAAAAKRPDKDA